MLAFHARGIELGRKVLSAVLRLADISLECEKVANSAHSGPQSFTIVHTETETESATYRIRPARHSTSQPPSGERL